MAQMLMPMWDDLGGRISGPFAFRLILQPMVAAILAIRAAWKDAQRSARDELEAVRAARESLAVLLSGLAAHK